MIVEFLRIIATLLLIVIILMDDFPFYNKLRDQSVQFILALLTLIIIYYDTTLGFIVALILMGLFGSFEEGKDKNFKNIFLAIGAIIAVIVVLTALQDFTWSGSNWWYDYGPALITLAVIGTLVAMVIGGKKD